jgi:8-oxo-dGTP pyrophosphatase MutT (NUDIX family)
MMDVVSKVIIRSGKFYLFSCKKAPGKKKDGLLEFIGGRLDQNESPFSAMLREAGEEEVTGSLVDQLLDKRPDAQELLVGNSNSCRRHYIYRIEIDEAIARLFRANNTESYGFKFVRDEIVDSDVQLRDYCNQLTPMTVKIFRALGRNV